ncbi:putative glucose-repressible alcohol dehydrogenase transcriptional effector like protein [Dictyocoela muelleri]|nr:putative glucose-repressible alcohol dehydrogenase transcriptional effector like protein [Dictyocoela muelleri]
MTTLTTLKKKNKYEISKSGINSWSGIDFSNQGIKNISEMLFDFVYLKELYLTNNNLQTIPPEIVQLRNLEVLDISSNMIKNIPNFLGKMNSLRYLVLNQNLISSCPMELGFLYKLEEFYLDGNPLVEPFSSIYATKGGIAVIIFCKENYMYDKPIDQTWIDLNNNNGELVSIASYNILTQRSTSSEIYNYVPSWALEWDYRKNLIVNEIRKISADILCIQEMENKTFKLFFKEKLQQICNYDVIFYPKNNGISDSDLNMADGCAIFWKKHRFTLIEHKCVEFSQIGLNDERFKECEDIINRNIDKNNIALIVVLEKFTGGQLIIVNSHLYWNPEYPDVKLFQTIILCEEVKKIKERYPAAGILLTGDYNSTKKSSVYELLTLGRIFPFNSDFLIYNYAPLTTKGYLHNLKLKDSFKDTDIEFTNYTPTFKDILDYIFYNDNLILASYLSPIDPDYVKRTIGFPTIHLPSDHILIGARFIMKNKKKGVYK